MQSAIHASQAMPLQYACGYDGSCPSAATAEEGADQRAPAIALPVAMAPDSLLAHHAREQGCTPPLDRRH